MLELIKERRRLRAEAQNVISVALGCECEVGVPAGDEPDFWWPDEQTEISLVLETDPGVIRITRITAEPQRHGYGTAVITALRTHAEDQGLTLEIPDPLAPSVSFWESFPWVNAGEDGRIVYRYSNDTAAG